jgi:hypothetical protein
LKRLAAICPGVTLLRLIHRAEEVLPAQRRRLCNQVQTYGRSPDGTQGFAVELEQAFFAARIGQPNIIPADSPKVEHVTPAPAPVTEHDQNGSNNRLVPPAETDSFASVSKFPLSLLLGNLAEQFIVSITNDVRQRLDRIEAAVTDALAARIAGGGTEGLQQRQELRRQQSPARLSRPRLGVIGLTKASYNHFANRISDIPWEPIFIDSWKEHPVLPPVDYMIVQSGCPHDIDKLARQMVPPDHYLFSDGGVTKMVQKIYDLHSRIVTRSLQTA